MKFPQSFSEVSFIPFEKNPESLTNYWKKILRKLEKNYEIAKFKIIREGLRKFLGNFTLYLGKVCRKSVKFQN